MREEKQLTSKKINSGRVCKGKKARMVNEKCYSTHNRSQKGWKVEECYNGEEKWSTENTEHSN